MMRAVPWIVVCAMACGGSQRSPLAKAGDEKDEGAGELARASMRLTTGDDDEAGFGRAHARSRHGDEYGGESYGGDPYGGAMYGGATYGGWAMPQWTYTPPNRLPRYNVTAGLSGAVEGAITWTGAPPPRIKTACGVIDNPTLRVTADHRVRGAVVYIDKIAVGRGTPYFGRPASVGGVLAKHGCALAPSVSIVTPLPGSVQIHGDATRAKLRVAAASGAPATFDLDEAGVVTVEIKAGATKVDSDDGKMAPAWVLGLDTPYYAVTDDAGRFRIDELAPGTYDVTLWVPPAASVGADGVVAVGAPLIVHRTVKIDSAGKTAQLSVTLPTR